jgi:hypothetical protein
MTKKVWVTSLSKDQNSISRLFATIKKYGLGPDGHFWVDDMKNMAWQAPLEILTAKQTALWVISATSAELEPPSIKYGLSLLCLCLQHERGPGFPIVFCCPDGSLDVTNLPTPFKRAEIVKQSDISLGAKLAARANLPVKKIAEEYRIGVHANPGYGIWFELGPAPGEIWEGVLAGARSSDVNAHGVGPAGSLPQKTVLEYQMQGLKLESGQDRYLAWAVKNRIDAQSSYYIRFADIPGKMLFGQLPKEDDDAADLHVIVLS